MSKLSGLQFDMSGSQASSASIEWIWLKNCLKVARFVVSFPSLPLSAR